MYFLDNSAHIFELPDYNQNPIGYEYDEQDYIFWFEDTNENTRLSVNNYYGKIINVLFEVSNVKDLNNTSISLIYDIDITCDSENFKLIKAIDFQNAINQNKSILDYINIEEQSKTLNSDDILIIKVTQDNRNFIMIPLYIIGTSKYSGTWLTNILIHIYNKFENKHTYCPITIGGIFNDEYEALVIHGQNMGINLPKEILKAINGTSYNNDVFDEELYNKKIKEYLLNYMNIKGELGNYNSAINSLKWFGYQDSIELYKLLETDNQIQTQYVRDYFDISQDIIKAFNYFINSQFVGLKYKLNNETGELYKQNINDKFWGEGLPILEDNESKYKMIHTNEFLSEEDGDDRNQQFKYLSSWVNYSLQELMFKLSYLKYYYQKYFLPIFIILKNLHIEYKVYSTPNKYLTYTYNHLYETIINNQSQSNQVKFSDEYILYFTHQRHLVDETFNEFETININGEYEIKTNTYEVNDTCLFVPIKFLYDTYYNCILILMDKDLNELIYKSKFSFINNDSNKYRGFVFYPKIVNELYTKLYTYVNKEYILYLNVNGKWYEYEFMSKIHEFDVHIGTLKYKYWINDINYFNEIYHKYADKKDENNDIIGYNENIEARFTIYKNNQQNINLDITDYIFDKDFFDYPLKYFSNFTQINNITSDKVIFNTYMNNPDFIYLNDIKFGLYEKNINENIENAKKDNIELSDEELSSIIQQTINFDIDQLVKSHQSKINLINNYKYLNNVHMYDLYKLTYEPYITNTNERINILKYMQNMSILCDNILIENSYIHNEFTITKLSYDTTITNSLDNYNHYLLENYINDISMNYNPLFYLNENNEGKTYYFILERDNNGITGNNASEMYSYYNDINNKYNIGYVICPIKNNKLDISLNIIKHNDYQINEGFNISKLSILNNQIFYKDNNYLYNVSFEFIPIVEKTGNDSYILDKYEIYDSSKNYPIGTQIYAQLKLYYYKQIKVLNIYGYYNSKYCLDFNDEDPNNITCTVDLNKIGIENIEPIYNVKLHEAANFISYSDIQYSLINNENSGINGIEISSLNPSLYWVTEETINEENNINSFINIEMQHGDYHKEDIKYINYLCQNLTGTKGTYMLDVVQDIDAVTLIVEVFDKNNNTFNTDHPVSSRIYSSGPNNILTLTGDENLVIAYFRFNNTILEFQQPIKFSPFIYPGSYTYTQIKYTGEENLVLLYKQFFYKKYCMSIRNKNSGRTYSKKEIWDSYIQLENNKIDLQEIELDKEINEDLNNSLYDTYLMHGKNSLNDPNEYWYFMFISKNTCDDSETLHSLNNYPQEIQIGDYILRHVVSKQLFLINRMDINYAKNVYHFNGDEMIVCSLHNNKMLPININMTSKWKLTPISHGANTNNVIYANTNTAIISVPNSNTYDKGYYNIQVNYSLDGNINNSTKINKKILIK